MKSLFALVLLVCGAGVAGLAQVSTATITGVVSDQTGAVLPGAAVKLTQTATNATFQAQSDARGYFNIPSVPVGPYVMDVTAQGFSAYQQAGIVLTVGQMANFNVQLAIGQVTQTVVVTAGAPLIDATTPTLSTTIDQQTVTDLPLNGTGRNPATLVFDAAGATNAALNAPAGTQLAGINPIIGSAMQGEIAPAVNGIRAGGTYFSLDGGTNVDPFNVLGGVFPDPDATQEFQVVTGTYGAQYVSAPGGAVNIITRAGTNQFHGTAFEFIRNPYFNAGNALTGIDDLKRNQFGGTIGGPVLKDKLFFFFSYQGTRVANQSSELNFVPTADERNGIFQACPITTTCSSSNEFPVNIATLPPVAGPNTLNPVNANFFNYMGSGSPLIPLPNVAGTNYFEFGLPSDFNDNQYVGRVDYQLSGTNRVYARYFGDRYNGQAVAYPTAAPYNIFDSAPSSQQYWDSYVLGDTWNPKPSWVFNSRVEFLNSVQNATAPSSNSQFNYPSFGAQNYSNPNPPGLGITVIGNTVPPAVSGFDKTPRTSFQVAEDAIWNRGNHEITFGGDYRYIHSGEYNPAGQTGVIIYEGIYTNIVGSIVGLQFPDSAFADFYTGHPIEFIQGDGFFQSLHGKLPSFYGQDKWRATNRLTVTGGLRWDPFLPYSNEHNQISCFIPGEQSTVFTNAATGLVFPGDPGCPSGGVNGSYGFVEPRVGFAYQADDKGDTVVRGGYGMYQIQVPLGALTGFDSWPFTRQYILANPFQSISNVWGSNGLANPFVNGFQTFGYQPPSNTPFPTAAPNISSFATNFRPGYAQQYSLSLQRQLGRSDSVELAYVGTKGTHMAQNTNINLASSGQAPPYNYPAFGAISSEGPIGWSNYNSAQVTYKHRVGLGLDVMSNFTWSKCFDNGSNPGSTGANSAGAVTNDAHNQQFNAGLCDFDQPFNWHNTFVYNTPSLQGSNKFLQEALGSWAWSGNILLQSGQPYSVNWGTGTYTVQLRANENPGVPLYVDGRLNYAAFSAPTGDEDGDSPRNGFRSPPNYQVDTALMKNFAITERVKLIFRAEAFNIINHPNYYNPNNLWSGASPQDFDVYQNAQDPRQLQFALKVQF